MVISLYRNRYRVESARLKGWDYSSDGRYFVTVCTRGRERFFGEVVDGRMRLSEIGEVAHRFWGEIPTHSTNAALDAFVIMPNHVHGIVIIKSGNNPHRSPPTSPGASGASAVPPGPGSLGAIVRSYKSAVTRWCWLNGYTAFAWQPRFYDRIIRDHTALRTVRRYILENPAKWELGRGLTPPGASRRTRP